MPYTTPTEDLVQAIHRWVAYQQSPDVQRYPRTDAEVVTVVRAVTDAALQEVGIATEAIYA